MLVCVIDPGLELAGIKHRAGWVIGRAEVDDVCDFVWQGRAKAVFSRRGHVDDIRPAFCFLVIAAGASRHGVGVDIDRVDGVADGDFVFYGEDIANVAAIAFCAIRNEYLVDIDIDSACVKVVFCYGFTQKIVALLGAEAVKCLRAGHIVYSFMHCVYD